ncbi:MAG: hypothetical protein IJP55_06375 [Bacteroidales bacterium]|nr:hypothetical protein [Bacteroidales bacterium]
MKKCIFTICAKNYIGLAQILGSSVQKYERDVDFYIVVADEFDSAIPAERPDNVLVAREILNIEDALWKNMAFKYNLTEFCTSIKPFCIEHFFGGGYDAVCYLDPDTYLFRDFSYVWENLEKYLVVTAPHVTLPQYPYTGDLPDRSFLFNGISNLGFGAFRNSEKVLNVVRWWQDRLKNQCFGEMLWAQCTDQKWTDFFPAFFDSEELLFSNNLGLNLAPWNYFERKVYCESGVWYVESRHGLSDRKDKLVFCHFAGYNYKEFASNGKVDNSSRIRISNLAEYPDIEPLVADYAKSIHSGRESFEKYLSLDYSYGHFDNGAAIDKLHRRLYNGVNSYFGFTDNPFSTAPGSLYYKFKKKGMISRRKSIDSVNETNMGSFPKKLKVIYAVLRVIYRLVGYRNYVLLLQFARRISLYDMNTFLLGKEYENYKLR